MKNFLLILYRNKNARLLGALFVLGGLISLWNGQDASYDILNYHLYNAYAFLTGRGGTDIIPGGGYNFFNPLVSIPYYLLFTKLAAYPRLVSFLSGYAWAVCAFFAVKIVFSVFKKNTIYTYIACVLGLAGVSAFSLAGSGNGDLQTAMFMLASIYCLTRERKIAWLAGFLAGVGLGLKFTNGPVIAGIGIAALFLFAREKGFWKNIILFSLCFGGGFLLTNGYFMYELYTKYQNPFFPFFNNIFKSPMFAFEAGTDPNFLPSSWTERLMLTFAWTRNTLSSGGYPFRDMKLALAVPFAFLLLLDIIFWGKKNYYETFYKHKLTAVLLFVTVTYVFWIKMFGTLRYFVTADFLHGIILAAAAARFLRFRYAKYVFAALAVFLLAYTRYPEMYENPSYSEKTIIMDDTKIEDGSFVLIAGRFSYFIPYSNPRAVYAGGLTLDELIYGSEPYFYVFPLYRHNFSPLIQKKINEHDGPFYVIQPLDPAISAPFSYNTEAFLSQWGLKTYDCAPMESNVNLEVLRPMLCRAERVKIIPPESHKVW